jgi:hypothetical protein
VILQGHNRSVDVACHAQCGLRVLFPDVFDDANEVVTGFQRPTDFRQERSIRSTRATISSCAMN